MKKIHLWLSIPSGIFITMMCLTGALMVFQQELLEIFNRDRYFVKQEEIGTRLTLDSVISLVNSRLEADTIQSAQVYSASDRTIQAALASGTRSYVYIHPYTGEITGYHNTRAGFFHSVMGLHRWLMLPDRTVGRVITGVSTIFLVIILITGIVRWFRYKRFTIKRNSHFVRRLFDSHHVLGIYTALVIMVCALSGLMWSFEWYRSGVAAIFHIKAATQKEKTKTDRKGNEAWQSAYEAVDADFQYVRIDKNGNVVVLPKNAANERATDSYKYSFGNRELTLVSRHGEERNRSYMMGWAYVIHTGSWGGQVTRWITFFASLAGASLPVTGYVLYIRRILCGRKRQAV